LPVYQLLGEAFGVLILAAMNLDAMLDVAVVADDVA
jgi:hypothetical protein